MTPDEISPDTSPFSEEPAPIGASAQSAHDVDLSFEATREVLTGSFSATGSAVGSVQATDVEAVGSAVGIARVDNDFVARFSSTPLVYAKGDATVRQSYASALIAGDTVEMSQAIAPLVAGRVIHIDMGGGVALLAGEAKVQRGWIGVLLAGRSEISEDSRVLIGTKAALIIAAALFGGFAMVAIAGLFGVRRYFEAYPEDLDALRDQLPWRQG